MSRDHISWKTKYAAALRLIGNIDYDHAKQMHEDQIISLFQVDHGILHAIDPINDHWNLTPRLRPEHKDKSRRDTGIVAKVKRIERMPERWRDILAPKKNIPKSTSRLKGKSRWPQGRKIASRKV